MTRSARLGALFLLCTAVSRSPAAVAAFQVPGSVEITRPVPGQTVSGLVTLEGSAAHPEFVRYDLAFAYANDATPTWFILAETVATQVYGGRLGIWDTTGISEGEYDVRLRVWTSAAEPLVAYLRGIHVARGVPPATATASAPPALPTPLPTSTPGAPPATPGPTPPALSSRPRRGAADRAFMTGAILGASGLASLGLYAWIRGRWRAGRAWPRRRPRLAPRRRAKPTSR